MKLRGYYFLTFPPTWQREIEEMRYKLANFSSTPDASVQKLNEVQLQKMTAQVNSDSPEKGMLYSNAVDLYIMLSLFLELV